MFQVEQDRARRTARALVVSVHLRAGRAGAAADAGFSEADAAEEIRQLAASAGLEVVSQVQARRDRPDPAMYLGSGKVDELAAQVAAHEAGLVVFDAALSPVQQRNLERALEVQVVDRTTLILDIFAQRARSSEGRLQVELAQLEHLATRLVRGWTHLERQRGGIGLRGGPGEKQLELDRRMITVRVKQLRERIKALGRQRHTRRRARERREVFTVCLVGYTNAGKSTLFNRLVRGDAYAADQLFATLDTTSRRCVVAEDAALVLSDTVGFVRALPHTLVEAFKSTLDEAVEADLLLHVVDAASPARDAQIAEVERVLAEIGAAEAARIQGPNKVDLLDGPAARGACASISRVFVSAAQGIGIDALRQALALQVRARRLPASEDDGVSPSEPPPARDADDGHPRPEPHA